MRRGEREKVTGTGRRRENTVGGAEVVKGRTKRRGKERGKSTEKGNE